MNMDLYFDKIEERLDNMTNEEFKQLLIESGVEKDIELKDKDRKIIKTKGKVVACYRSDDSLLKK